MAARRQITDAQLTEAAGLLATGQSLQQVADWLRDTHGVEVSKQGLHKALGSRSEAPEVNRAIVAESLRATIVRRARSLDWVYARQLRIVRAYQEALIGADIATLQSHASALKAHVAALVAISGPLLKSAGLEPSGVTTASGPVDVMACIRARILAEEEEAERLRNETLPDDDPVDSDEGADDAGPEPPSDPAVEAPNTDEPTEAAGMDAGPLAEAS